MSFILDALKKSETDRQRQDTPGIANIPESGKKEGGSRWVWIIAGLLAINLAVLAAIMLKPDGDGEPAVSRPLPVAAQPETAPESFSNLVREAKRSSPEPAAPANGEAAAAAEETPAPTQTVTEGLPTLDELRANGLQLPDMHLDIHVYSGQAADRFVFVNMSKYTESSRLSEGPVLVEITPDGAILDYLGTRFLLPRE